MKKQTITAIAAPLLWGAFFIGLLFFVVQAMPRALAQRHLQNRSPVANTAHVAGFSRSHAPSAPAMPHAPMVVLYDQYNNPGANATLSATFTDFANFSSDLADDFVVPAGQTWNVQSVDADGVYFNGAGPATSWNVFFYANSGTLPGAQVFSATNLPVTQSGTTFTVNLPSAAVLSAGTYWVEIQANMTFGTQGEWGWTDRTVQSNSPAAWQNPGGGFAVCPTWMPKLANCVTTASGPDQVFRLNGTLGSCMLMWQAAANMPTDLYGAAGASNGTYAYFAGGYSFSSGTTLNTLFRYDPVANTWATMAPELQGGIEALAVYYPTTNKIYVFGGEDAVSGTNYNLTQIYDIATNTWTTGATMPDVRSFLAGGYNSANGKIYLVSGYNTGTVDSAQPDTWEYDPVANTFTTKTPFPHPAGGMGSGVIGGHLYVAGGRDASNTVINLTWDYNIAANTWTPKANEPGSNNNVPGSGVASNNFWVFGGGNPFVGPRGETSSKAAFIKPSKAGANGKVETPATTGSTLVYDPGSDTWLTGPNMTSVRSFPGGTNIGNTLVAAGGYNGATTVASAETLAANCTPTPTPCVGQYAITQIGGSIVPGTVDTGNHCDDCTTNVALPFSYTLYDQSYTSVNVDSNGTLQFGSNLSVFTNTCLPSANHSYTIFPYWDDLYTVNAGFGIFTSVSGTAPNRIFNIEWREQYFPGSGNAAFEVRLYEGQTRFDVIYGATDSGNASSTAGVQKNTEFTQYFCNGGGGAATGGQSYVLTSCNQPTVSSAVSRKTHGAAGPFDVSLPLTGTPGIEDRSGGATGDFTMVVTFTGNVTVTGSPQAQVTLGTGCVGSGGVCAGGNNVTVSGATVTIPLTNVANAQTINVRLNGVNTAAQPAADITIPMSILLGDTNANGAVNSADIGQTKAQTGQTANASNFRTDVNESGSITSSDISIVKAASGTSLP
jgi:hypothetical protein